MAEIEAAEAETEPALERERPIIQPADRKAAKVDAVTEARAAHVRAKERLKDLRHEIVRASVEEAQSLDVLKAARLALIKEAEGEEP